MPSTPFDLHKLGWKAFEDLVACIFREVMGQSFQSFTAGPDGGRDGAFYGTWETQCGDTLSGSCTIQCKHSSKPESNPTDSTIQDELVTIEHLAAEGLADVYIFVTNLRLSGNVEKTATRAIQAAGAGTAPHLRTPMDRGSNLRESKAPETCSQVVRARRFDSDHDSPSLSSSSFHAGTSCSRPSLLRSYRQLPKVRTRLTRVRLCPFVGGTRQWKNHDRQSPCLIGC